MSLYRIDKFQLWFGCDRWHLTLYKLWYRSHLLSNGSSKLFERWSDLKTNFQKSIIFLKMSPRISLESWLYQNGFFIHLPISPGKLWCQDWITLIEHMEKKLHGWKGKLLSWLGEPHSWMLLAMPSCFLSYFVILTCVVYRRKFLWSGLIQVKRDTT